MCVPVCVFGHVCICLSVCPYFCSSFCKIGQVCLPVSLFVVCFHICGSMPVCLLSVSFNNMGIFVVFYLLFSVSQLIFLVVCVCLCVGVSVSIHVYEHLRIMNTFIVMIILYAVCVCFPFFIHYFISQFHS